MHLTRSACTSPALLLLLAAPSVFVDAAHSMRIAYNTSGPISVFPFGSFKLTFDGVDVIGAGFPKAETFTFANGTNPNFDWMRTPLNRTFDAATATYNASYRWGSFVVQHILSSPLSLDMEVSVTNTMDVDVGITGGLFGVHSDEVYWAPNASNFIPPLGVTGFGYACAGCWPPDCGNFITCDAAHPQGIPIDFRSGAAAWVRADAPPPLPQPQPAPGAAPWLTPSILSPDRLDTAGSRYTLNAALSGVLPGGGAAARGRFSLRFGDGTGVAPAPPNPGGPLALVQDVFAAFGRARPQTTPLLVGGPTGALFGSGCGASCVCKSWSPEDCPNPRGWDSSIGQNINTTSAEGVARFQDLARSWVNRSVDYCVNVLGPGPAACSGILFWSVEGSEYYQPDPVYIGSPDMLPLLAPEMDAIADELMKMVTGAGLRLGFTLRPQKLTQNAGWNASQPPWFQPQRWHQHDFYLPDNATDVAGYANNLIGKVTYARSRWGASMFYVDTTVNANGVLPFQVWDAVAKAHPDVIFFPEQSEVNYFSVVAPLQDNWGEQAIPVNPAIKAIWPRAYSLQLMQFPLNFTVAPFQDWVDLVRAGDSLIVQPWYNGTEQWNIKRIYEAARAAEA